MTPGSRLPLSYLSLLSTLLRAPSVVGAEHSFFRALQRELEERGAKVTWYEGVLVAQGSRPMSLMFSAHIDRHGLICTGPGEFQYAAFVAGGRSDLTGNSVSEEMMTQIAGRFKNEDVYAYEPWSGAYRGRGEIRNSWICEHRNNLIFELEGMSHLVAGTPVAFNDRLKYENSLLSGQLDNVLTAAALVHLFEQGFEGTAFFTAQEEAGKSWRYLLEWFRRFGGSTNQLIVVDTSPFDNLDLAVPGSLILRNRDANASFNQSLTETLQHLCLEANVPALFKDSIIEQENQQRRQSKLPEKSLGSTEMGRIVAASQRLVDGTTLQIPTTGYHTMHETAHEESVAAFLNLLQRLMLAS